MNNTRNLVDKESIAQVLGCFIKKPSIVEETGLELSRDDFPEKFHKLVFATAYNLYLEDVGHIDSIAIDSYLASYPKTYSTFVDNNGIDYVETIVDQAILENFEYNYKRVKKFSMLREYVDKGIDISEIYDDTITSNSDYEEMLSRFDALDLKDISNKINLKLNLIDEKFLSHSENTELHAGVGMRALKEKLKKAPEYGSALNGKICNTVFRGARKKKVYLRSAPTGIGKCLVGDTLINTDKGLMPIEDIPKFYEVGTLGVTKAKIISYDVSKGEKKILPTSHWYNMGHSKTIKITTKKGYKIEGTYEHPIVIGGVDGDYDFKRLEEVSKDDLVAISINNQLFGREVMDLDSAYLMGVSLGNKNSSNLNEKSLQQKDREEYIPQSIMMGTKEVVQAFLRGLFDTGGNITKRGFELSSTSERLISEIHIILNNFGIIATKKAKTVNEKDFHIITITDYNNMEVFYREIGFLNEINKKERLEKIVSEKNNVNSNFDFITDRDGLELLHIYLKQNDPSYKHNKEKALSYKRNGFGFYESLKNNKRISRERMVAIMQDLDYEKLTPELKKLFNTVNNIFFDEIASIEFSEAVVYDFTVPETHSFVANGMISHNTRLAIGDAMHIGSSHMYDTDSKQWVSIGVDEPVLFITTELEEDEVQTMMMSYLSGVDEDKILDGKYTQQEEERVDYAIDLIENSDIHIVYLPDFDIEEVERTIKKYILKYGVEHVFFDYIHISLSLLEEISTASKGMKLREDSVLLMFITRLKQLCNSLGVFLYTSTQVNGDYLTNAVIDQNVLRGAKSMADKIDVGIIALEPSVAELECLAKGLRDDFGVKTPNMIYHIYKNRRGKYNKVKIWSYVDLGTCRSEDIFITDQNNQLLPIELIDIVTYIEKEEAQTETVDMETGEIF